MSRPKKRDILQLLKRDELLDFVDEHDLHVEDRRVRDQLIDALDQSRKANLAELLAALPRTRLKAMCRERYQGHPHFSLSSKR